MRRCPFFLLAVLACTILCAAPHAYCKPVSALLFPSGAQVREQSRVTLQPSGDLLAATFTLPQQADPQSLRIAAPAGTDLIPAGMNVDKTKSVDKTAIAELRARLKTERNNRQALVDSLGVAKAEITFWNTQGTVQTEKAAEATALAAAMAGGLGKALSRASALGRDITAADETIRDLERQLSEQTGGAKQQWRVTALFRGEGPKSIDLTYSYRLSAAGWKPQYTFNAHPDTGTVDFSWDATVWQSTGAAWDTVDITLATASFARGTTPPRLPQWTISVFEPTIPSPMPVMKTNAMKRTADSMAEKALGGVAAAPPVRTQGQHFDRYDVGRTTLQAGQRKRLPLRQETWKAGFDYLIRPYIAPKAYVRAQVTLEQSAKIPAGEALFLLDSALVRKGSFSLFAKETNLFFGADPQIEVTLERRERTSGESGFLSKKKTADWDWNVTVANGKSLPAPVRMEDRVPRPLDKRITVERRLGDAEVEDDDLAVWTFTLPGGGDKSVQYGYSVEYPSDMKLDFGGR